MSPTFPRSPFPYFPVSHAEHAPETMPKPKTSFWYSGISAARPSKDLAWDSWHLRSIKSFPVICPGWTIPTIWALFPLLWYWYRWCRSRLIFGTGPPRCMEASVLRGDVAHPAPCRLGVAGTAADSHTPCDLTLGHCRPGEGGHSESKMGTSKLVLMKGKMQPMDKGPMKPSLQRGRDPLSEIPFVRQTWIACQEWFACRFLG